MDNGFCNRVKHIAVLSVLPKGWTKELNLVDWNHHGVKFDIRDWSPDHNNVTKGITLCRSETIELAKILNIMDFSLIAERQKKNDSKKENTVTVVNGSEDEGDIPYTNDLTDSLSLDNEEDEIINNELN